MADEKQKQNSPMIIRAAFDPKSINIEGRTVDVTFATETPVRMWNWQIGEFDEILSMDPAHIRMDRLKNGIPLLDNHARYGGTKAVLGVVESATFSNKEGRASVRFSKREDVEPTFQDVKDGILRGISVGYRVHKYMDMNPLRAEGEVPQLKAIDWEPMEISLAPVQADPNSNVREQGGENYEVEIISTRNQNQSNKSMADEKDQKETQERKDNPPASPTPAAPVNVEEVRQAATAAERSRVSAINDAVRKAGLEQSFADTLINGGKSIEEARAAIIEKWAENDPNKGQRNGVVVAADEADKRRDAMTNSLVLRATPDAAKNLKPEQVEAAREYRGQSLLEMAKDSLIRAGVDIKGMDKMEIAGRAITQSTSDFPVLLEGTNRRVLLASYEAIADTWRRFCTTGSVGDFRDYKRLRLGSFGNLDTVGENSEFKNKSIPDAEYEKISAKTKGNIINVSRQMIVNDDLAGFTRLAQMLGRAAARSIEADVYALLLSNSGNGPTMADGKALFHVDHKNINATGSALSVAGLDADRIVMASQMDPSSNDYIGLTPSILLVPMGLESTAKVLNTSTYDPDATNKLQRPNTALGMFNDIIGTQRLTGTVRYLFANPNEEPVFEVAFLDGVQTPFLESEQGFRIDGMQWKVRLDYGVGAIGWRGVVRNAGV